MSAAKLMQQAQLQIPSANRAGFLSLQSLCFRLGFVCKPPDRQTGRPRRGATDFHVAVLRIHSDPAAGGLAVPAPAGPRRGFDAFPWLRGMTGVLSCSVPGLPESSGKGVLISL